MSDISEKHKLLINDFSNEKWEKVMINGYLRPNDINLSLIMDFFRECMISPDYLSFRLNFYSLYQFVNPYHYSFFISLCELTTKTIEKHTDFNNLGEEFTFEKYYILSYTKNDFLNSFLEERLLLFTKLINGNTYEVSEKLFSDRKTFGDSIGYGKGNFIETLDDIRRIKNDDCYDPERDIMRSFEEGNQEDFGF
jgi:hypothetical protein